MAVVDAVPVFEAWGGWTLATAAEAGLFGAGVLLVGGVLRAIRCPPPARWAAALLFVALLRFLIPPVFELPVRSARVILEVGGSGTPETGLLLTFLAGCQAVGLLVGLVLLGRSAIVLRRTLARSTRVEDGQTLDALRDIARRLGIPVPRLFITDDGSPAAAGLRRPVILLPRALLGLDRAGLRMVLAHEAAHLARRDPLAAAIRTLALSLWWAHPVAWALARRHRAAAEDACDDVVLGMDASPADYCDALLACAAATPPRRPFGPPRSVGVALGGHPLERRFRRIFRTTGRRPRPAEAGRTRALTAVLALAALALPVRFLALDTDTVGGPGDDIVIRHVIADVRRPARAVE